ncbi:MAG: SDR family NAD(P)-dependent oxidoreductase [Rhodospirillaceae bacterium]
MTETTAPPFALIAGAGPGLGEALMRRFRDQGHRVLGLARTARQTEDGLTVQSLDLTDTEQMPAQLDALVAQNGVPTVVVHNPAKLLIAPLAETDPADFEAVWKATCLSAMLLGRSLLPKMADAGGGSFLVSGATASLRGGARFAAFASAKFALRGLTQAMAREFQPQGIHVAHVILDGIIDTPNSRSMHGLSEDKMMNTAEIAETYWQLAAQPRSTWTHELDLRPMAERF